MSGHEQAGQTHLDTSEDLQAQRSDAQESQDAPAESQGVPKLLYTIAEAAAALDMPYPEVEQLVWRGEIGSLKIGPHARQIPITALLKAPNAHLSSAQTHSGTVAGMRPDVLAGYLYELGTQCRMAQAAIQETADALHDAFMDEFAVEGYVDASSPFMPANPPGEAIVRFWSHLQVFLTACANISKCLWPRGVGNKAKSAFADARGAALCSLLGIDDTNALGSRTLRNQVEHFDKHLDQWAQAVAASDDASIAVRAITAGGSAPLTHDPDRSFFVFDAQLYSVTVQGKAALLIPLSWAIDDLAQRVDDALQRLRGS